MKRYNKLYADINIDENNLNWIEDGTEQQLPPSIIQTHNNYSPLKCNEDRGPSSGQIADVNDQNLNVEPSYGTIGKFNSHMPKEKDTSVIEAIREAEESTDKVNTGKKRAKIDFPYVSPQPICEYTERHLFEKAFPWLFPGGVGGYTNITPPKPTLADWMSKTLLYKDGRFSRDKMWAFCALNYLARHANQNSGSFFVDSFLKNGPKPLEDCKPVLGLVINLG